MTYKMKGPSLYKKLKVNRNGYANMPDGRSKSSPFQQEDEDGVPRKNKKGHPVPTETGTSGKKLKTKYKAMEAVNDAGDQIEFLNEDYFNERLSKSEYDAKMKILRMKEDAAIKANKATPPEKL